MVSKGPLASSNCQYGLSAIHIHMSDTYGSMRSVSWILQMPLPAMKVRLCCMSTVLTAPAWWRFADSGRSMHPGPVLHHEALEQDGLPRAALYVPGNPSLLAVSRDDQPDSKARREAHGHMDARVSSASSAEGRGHMGGHVSSAEGLMERSSSAPDQALGIGRMLSIKDRIAALESCNSQSLGLGRRARCARSASPDRQGDLPSKLGRLPDDGSAETADAECTIEVKAIPADDREETAGIPCDDKVEATAAALPDADRGAASQQAEDAAVIGTETFPDCMYVGAFKHGMRDGLGARPWAS